MDATHARPKPHLFIDTPAPRTDDAIQCYNKFLVPLFVHPFQVEITMCALFYCCLLFLGKKKEKLC